VPTNSAEHERRITSDARDQMTGTLPIELRLITAISSKAPMVYMIPAVPYMAHILLIPPYRECIIHIGAAGL
jgi:hypothetical protein